ncbi:hypothetical protein HDV00_002034 [Rhizophlyctis rosea]|nr:hypothetical protein HDV00_002034 [Rhizophlyctis rosea]
MTASFKNERTHEGSLDRLSNRSESPDLFTFVEPPQSSHATLSTAIARVLDGISDVKDESLKSAFTIANAIEDLKKHNAPGFLITANAAKADFIQSAREEASLASKNFHAAIDIDTIVSVVADSNKEHLQATSKLLQSIYDTSKIATVIEDATSKSVQCSLEVKDAFVQSATKISNAIEDANEQNLKSMANHFAETQQSVSKSVTAAHSINDTNIRALTEITQVIKDDASKTNNDLLSIIKSFHDMTLRSNTDLANILTDVNLFTRGLNHTVTTTNETATAKIIKAIQETTEKSTNKIVKAIQATSEKSTSKITANVTILKNAIETADKHSLKAHKIQTLQWAITNASSLSHSCYEVTENPPGHQVRLTDAGRSATQANVECNFKAYMEQLVENVSSLTGQQPRVVDADGGKKIIYYD